MPPTPPKRTIDVSGYVGLVFFDTELRSMKARLEHEQGVPNTKVGLASFSLWL
jgi:hypothetical protein